MKIAIAALLTGTATAFTLSPHVKSTTSLSMTRTLEHGLGWRPDIPDFRDYTSETDSVKTVLNESEGYRAASSMTLPQAVDLSEHCSPVEDQGTLGSCTANAGVGLFEYYQRRAYGRHIDGSRLFLYKATRNLMGLQGDTGAHLRSTMGAMALFGIPPTEYWKYDISSFDEEPPAFCYSFASNYQALKYYRLDPRNAEPEGVLDSVKQFLASGLPSMFGFTVYSSINEADQTGEIPFPSYGDRVAGGHAVVAIGYDDNKKIGDCKGALKIRNSWGAGWGDEGYGWLPYDYIRYGIAQDFWALLENEFKDTSLFKETPRWAVEAVGATLKGA
jgi:C1A family cysteine protease